METLNFAELKLDLCNLIEKYNSSSENRTLTLVDNFGEEWFERNRIYWAYWSDEKKSTHLVGFKYQAGSFYSSGNFICRAKPLSLEEALNDFNAQLSKIPKK